MTDRGTVIGSARWFAIAEQQQRELADRLRGGGGGGTSDGMEPRIAKLEAHAEHANKQLDRLASLPAEVARLQERVAHLPSKPWMFTTLAAMLAALAAIVGLIVRFIPHA